MLYDFKDTIANEASASSLPSEAMNFNGQFIEHLIPGYRTLTVSGREGIETNINSLKINTTIGEWISTTTLPARILTVNYALSADSPHHLMRKWHELNMILAVDKTGVPKQNVPIWFNDDSDIVYYGMKQTMDAPPPGALSFTSSYTLFCSEPTKFSKAKASEVVWGSTSINFTANYLLGNRGTGADGKAITGNTNITCSVEGKSVKPIIELVGSGSNVKIACDGKIINIGSFTDQIIKIDTELFIGYVNGSETIFDMDDFYIVDNEPVIITGNNMNFKLTIDYNNAFI